MPRPGLLTFYIPTLLHFRVLWNLAEQKTRSQTLKFILTTSQNADISQVVGLCKDLYSTLPLMHFSLFPSSSLQAGQTNPQQSLGWTLAFLHCVCKIQNKVKIDSSVLDRHCICSPTAETSTNPELRYLLLATQVYTCKQLQVNAFKPWLWAPCGGVNNPSVSVMRVDVTDRTRSPTWIRRHWINGLSVSTRLWVFTISYHCCGGLAKMVRRRIPVPKSRGSSPLSLTFGRSQNHSATYFLSHFSQTKSIIMKSCFATVHKKWFITL